MVDESTDPELTFTSEVGRHTNDRQRRSNVEEKKDGHRAYSAERKAKSGGAGGGAVAVVTPRPTQGSQA